MHGFLVRTPICHIVPVSRAYGSPPKLRGWTVSVSPHLRANLLLVQKEWYGIAIPYSARGGYSAWATTYSWDFDQKSLGVHKNSLSAKFGSPPPPGKRPRMRRNCTNQYEILKIDTFSGGGGGETRLYGQDDFMDIWAFLIWGLSKTQALYTDPKSHSRATRRTLPYWKCYGARIRIILLPP